MTCKVPIAILLALAAVGTMSGDAAAYEGSLAPEDNTVWLHVRAGILFADEVAVDDQVFERAGSAAPSFGIGVSWRISQFDLGGVVEHYGGGRYERGNGDARIGGHVAVAGVARWRFLEERWGGFFSRFSLGLGAFGHTDELRVDVAVPRGMRLGDIEPASVGLSFTGGVGFIYWISERLGVQAEVGVVTTWAPLNGRSVRMDYTRLRGVVAASIEWRPW